MFISCFSNTSVAKGYWTAAFFTENTILGILLEDAIELSILPSSHLGEEIFRLGKGMGFPDNCPQPRPSIGWFEEFVDSEIPQLEKLLKDCCDKTGFTSLLPGDSRLSINEDVLKACMQADDAFRAFILQRIAS